MKDLVELRRKRLRKAITAFSVRETKDYIGFERKSSMSKWGKSKMFVVANAENSVLDE